ncbi:bacteriocin immunity protein [Streptomyces hiroshimensis]|uniref:E9imm peptide n=1 Tax=Streptomyces hiroshimensis TaxID=66424 RepID=A0ABQ2Z5A4_9ACTN|nr:bacteriocin immunity protein [Streptomyces hiroshimensis]GGY01644.1 hypothetical protein GCM10010324_55770 [Streptomyces hiroshimensis]
MDRQEAVGLVQRVMDADYATEAEGDRLAELLDRGLACPSGYVTDLIFWPRGRELSAEEVVDRALEYRPIAL